MREHIKLFESQDQKIREFMKKHKIKDYTRTPEGVDVHEEVTLANYVLPELPFQFNVIHGNFACSDNKIQSLRGAPRVVHGDFCCTWNKLQSLEFCPKFVQGVFYCNNNDIEPWEHRYLLFSEVQGKIFTDKNDLDRFFRKYQNKKALIPEALKELRELQKRWEQMNARTY